MREITYEELKEEHGLSNKQIQKFRDKKKLSKKIEKFKGDFDKNTKFIAFTNAYLSKWQKELLGYSGLKTGDKAILFAGVKDYYTNGDTVEVESRDEWFDINGLEKWRIKIDDVLAPKKYIICGDYQVYKDVLKERHHEAKVITNNIAKSYKINPYKVGSNVRVNSRDKYSYREAWAKYFEIKNAPFARHEQFITTYKAQGKSYRDVVVAVDNMPDDEHLYVAISRAMERLRIKKR